MDKDDQQRFTLTLSVGKELAAALMGDGGVILLIEEGHTTFDAYATYPLRRISWAGYIDKLAAEIETRQGRNELT